MLETASQVREIHGFRFHALGGAGRIRIAHASRAVAERAVADAVRWLRETEALLSRFRPESLVSRLNREGRCRADAMLLSLLAAGERARAQTHGRLSLTALPLWNLWHDPARATWPTEPEIATASARCDPDGLTRNGADVCLRPGMSIDLGGIAKEWCVDQLVVRLKASGLDDFLVELAGDVAARGRQPGHAGWWVLLPDGRHAFPLRNAALATSGHHERCRWLTGKRVSHLLDAATGHPASGAISTATVLAENCTTAGIRASDAALAATPEEAWSRIEFHEGLLLTPNQTASFSPKLAAACAEVTASNPGLA